MRDPPGLTTRVEADGHWGRVAVDMDYMGIHRSDAHLCLRKLIQK